MRRVPIKQNPTRLSQIKQIQKVINKREESFTEWLQGKRPQIQEKTIIQSGSGFEINIREEDGPDLNVEIPDGDGGHHNINCNCSVFIHIVSVIKDLFTPCCKPS